MPGIRLAPRAEQDVEAILAWTHEAFGEKARFRYKVLLPRAILDVAESPERVGSHERPEITDTARTYHLSIKRVRFGEPEFCDISFLASSRSSIL